MGKPISRERLSEVAFQYLLLVVRSGYSPGVLSVKEACKGAGSWVGEIQELCGEHEKYISLYPHAGLVHLGKPATTTELRALWHRMGNSFRCKEWSEGEWLH